MTINQLKNQFVEFTNLTDYEYYSFRCYPERPLDSTYWGLYLDEKNQLFINGVESPYYLQDIISANTFAEEDDGLCFKISFQGGDSLVIHEDFLSGSIHLYHSDLLAEYQYLCSRELANLKKSVLSHDIPFEVEQMSHVYDKKEVIQRVVRTLLLLVEELLDVSQSSRLIIENIASVYVMLSVLNNRPGFMDESYFCMSIDKSLNKLRQEISNYYNRQPTNMLFWAMQEQMKNYPEYSTAKRISPFFPGGCRLTKSEQSGHLFTLTVPRDIQKQTLEKYYQKLLEKAGSDLLGKEVTINILLEKETT